MSDQKNSNEVPKVPATTEHVKKSKEPVNNEKKK